VCALSWVDKFDSHLKTIENDKLLTNMISTTCFKICSYVSVFPTVHRNVHVMRKLDSQCCESMGNYFSKVKCENQEVKIS
jgi:hypothetical protein